MEQEFKPFTLEVKVNSLKELKALWLIANAQYSVDTFLNEHYQNKEYKLGIVKHPLGKHWVELNNIFEPFKEYK